MTVGNRHVKGKMKSSSKGYFKIGRGRNFENGIVKDILKTKFKDSSNISVNYMLKSKCKGEVVIEVRRKNGSEL